MIDYNLLNIQNPWWENKEQIENDPQIREFKASSVAYLPHNILDLKLKPDDIHILLGPRQTGKSTTLKLLIKKLIQQDFPAERILYFNCDALSSRKDVIDVVISFVEGIKSSSAKVPLNYIFLDEISSIEEWPFSIKWLADSGMLFYSNIILSGSSSINLKKSGEYLPGRRGKGTDLTYLPINFATYFQLLHKDFESASKITSFDDLTKLNSLVIRKRINVKEDMKKFLLTGGFLKIIDVFAKKETYDDTVELYKNTLKSELAKFGRKEIPSRQILNKIIGSLGSETSYTNVAEEAELGSKNTAYEYLNFFSDTFLLSEIYFYEISQKRVVIKKNKKYYPTDPFLIWLFYAYVTGSNNIESFYRKYITSPLDSQLAEVFIASELYKQKQEVYFFKNTRELDFYVPQKELGIEIKYKEKVTSQDLEGLKYAKQKVVVSKNILEKRGDILVIPMYLSGFINWKEFKFR